VAFLRHAIDLDCPQFRSALFSAKGTFLRQPRVKRRESANVAEPWEEIRWNRKPQRGGANCQGHIRLGPPLWGFGRVILATQGCATFVLLTSLHPGLV